jgi:protein-tyrosine phosphatase
MTSAHSRFNPIQVTERLFVGPGPSSVEDIETLVSLGVTSVLSLQTDADLASRGLRWNTTWQLMLARGITAVRCPIVDFDTRDFARQLSLAVEALDDLMGPGDGSERVYVHCTAGINRSPSVVLAWLSVREGLTAGRARLTQAHPQAIPYDDLVAKWLKKR